MQEIAVGERLCQFVRECGDDQCSLELLLFLGKHPDTRFCRLAIVHALNAQRRDIERALRHLINKGLVKICAGNGVPLYSLTEAEPPRSLVLDLAALDWRQWQVLLEQTRSEHRGYLFTSPLSLP